ncbi:transporter substrate-binding domain-containing protein [Pseudomonas sp. ABC1]|nr:transporter substrate-binding domain-containing protein [Pseudomonas sp. ABC1]
MLCLSTATAQAAPASPELVVGYYDFPPEIYTDAEGFVHGPVIDLTRQVLKEAGYRAVYRQLASARLYRDLIEGNIDLWVGAAGKPGLVEHTLESRNILGQTRINLYFRPDTRPPRIPEDLVGKELIVLGGYSYSQDLAALFDNADMALQLRRTGTHESALQMLMHRRADYVLGYQSPMQEAVRKAGMDMLPHLALQDVPIRFIISRRSHDSLGLRDALDRAYERLSQDNQDIRLPLPSARAAWPLP